MPEAKKNFDSKTFRFVISVLLFLLGVVLAGSVALFSLDFIGTIVLLYKTYSVLYAILLILILAFCVIFLELFRQRLNTDMTHWQGKFYLKNVLFLPIRVIAVSCTTLLALLFPKLSHLLIGGLGALIVPFFLALLIILLFFSKPKSFFWSWGLVTAVTIVFGVFIPW